MWPFLRPGDIVHVRPLSAGEPCVGDVLCYEPWPGTLHLHRVVARDERGFVTRGDALTYREQVPAGVVLGRVTACERAGRLRNLDVPAARVRGRLIALVAPGLARLLPLALSARRLWRGRSRA